MLTFACRLVVRRLPWLEGRNLLPAGISVVPADEAGTSVLLRRPLPVQPWSWIKPVALDRGTATVRRVCFWSCLLSAAQSTELGVFLGVGGSAECVEWCPMHDEVPSAAEAEFLAVIASDAAQPSASQLIVELGVNLMLQAPSICGACPVSRRARRTQMHSCSSACCTRPAFTALHGAQPPTRNLPPTAFEHGPRKIIHS